MSGDTSGTEFSEPEEYNFASTGKRLLSGSKNSDERIAKRSCPENPLKDMNGRSAPRAKQSVGTKKAPKKSYFDEERFTPDRRTPKSTRLRREQVISVLDFDDEDVGEHDLSGHSTPRTNPSTSSKETPPTSQVESSDDGDSPPTHFSNSRELADDVDEELQDRADDVDEELRDRADDVDDNQHSELPPVGAEQPDQLDKIAGLLETVIKRMDKMEKKFEERFEATSSSTSSSEASKKKKRKSFGPSKDQDIPLIVRVCSIHSTH